MWCFDSRTSRGEREATGDRPDPARPEEPHERAPDLAAVLTESGLDGRVTDDIKRDMWRKVIFNCVINPITAIVGSPVGGISAPATASIARSTRH